MAQLEKDTPIPGRLEGQPQAKECALRPCAGKKGGEARDSPRATKGLQFRSMSLQHTQRRHDLQSCQINPCCF